MITLWPEMSKWGNQDINTWYAKHNGVCPNCGTDFKQYPPEFNIYPHYAGECVKEAE